MQQLCNHWYNCFSTVCFVRQECVRENSWPWVIVNCSPIPQKFFRRWLAPLVGSKKFRTETTNRKRGTGERGKACRFSRFSEGRRSLLTCVPLDLHLKWLFYESWIYSYLIFDACPYGNKDCTDNWPYRQNCKIALQRQGQDISAEMRNEVQSWKRGSHSNKSALFNYPASLDRISTTVQRDLQSTLSGELIFAQRIHRRTPYYIGLVVVT